MSFEIDYNKCIKCGKCIRDCVSAALVMNDDGPSYGSMGERGCIKCQHCQSICPVAAISVDGLKADELPKIEGVDYDSFNQIKKIVRNRYSIRKFKSEILDKKTIEKILNEVNFAPSGCNFRGLKFVVVSNPDKLLELRAYFVEKIIAALDNNVLPSSLHNLFSSMRDEMLSGEDVFFRGAPHVIFVANHKKTICPEDAIIALTNFEIIANSMNLGTTWFGLGYMFFKYIDQDFYKVLGLEDDYELAYAMIFGKRDIEYLREKSPKPYPVSYL